MKLHKTHCLKKDLHRFYAKKELQRFASLSNFLSLPYQPLNITTMKEYTIQANTSGTRTIEVSEENLRTIEKYALFRHLIDSNGIVDEDVLEKLRLNVRSLIASQENDSKDLLDLCIDVIYHNNMKAFGLQQLIRLYLSWLHAQPADE